MQNNSSTVEEAFPLPLDRGEIVTIPRLELDELINRAASNAAEKAVSEAVEQFQSLFIETMGKETGKGKKWLNTAAAAALLGKRPDQLREMVSDGRLRLGREVRDDRPKSSIRSVYVFHIPNCEQRLLTSPKERGNK
jgi:hypothetical protein